MAISSHVSETLMMMLNPYSKFEGSILKHFKVILISIPTSPQWFYSVTQAVTSQAENSDLLKRVLIE